MEKKFTEEIVAKFAPADKRIEHRDSEVAGLGVRIEPDGERAYFWHRKVNGASKFRSIGDAKTFTVKEARAEADRFNGLVATWKQAGYPADADPFARAVKSAPVARATVPTFQELIDAYVEQHVKADLDKPAASEAERILRTRKIVKAEYFVRWMVSKKLASWVDRPMDKITINDVLDVKRACGKRHYIANRLIQFVRALYSWSSDSDDGKARFLKCENPASDVSTYDVSDPRKVYLQPDELLRFNEQLEDEKTDGDLRDMLILAINTGARRGNIYSMRFDTISFDLETWVVPYSKNASAYTVQLLPPALEVLERRRKKIPEGEPYVFPANSASGHVEDFDRRWNKFRTAAKLPHIRIHDIRRSVGSYMAIAGESLQKIAATLGHRSVKATESTYSHLLDASVKEARQAGQNEMVRRMAAASERQKLLGATQAAVAVKSKR
jgi:integrase